MVESVSLGSAKVGDLPPLARIATSAPVRSVASESAAEEPAVRSTARTLAASPPVDTDRIQRIKAAIASGTFPINPATIADQLIALRYDWMSNDQA